MDKLSKPLILYKVLTIRPSISQFNEVSNSIWNTQEI